jgi:hypothetical protein
MEDIIDLIYSDESMPRKPMDSKKKQLINNNLKKIVSKKNVVVMKLSQTQIKIVQKMKAKFIRMKQIKIHYKKEEEFKDFVIEIFNEYIENLKESGSSWFKKNMSFPIMEIECNMMFKEAVLSFVNSLAEQNKMKIINRDNVPLGMSVPTEKEKEESEKIEFPSYYLSHSESYKGQEMLIRVSIGSSFIFENPYAPKKKEE